MLKGLTGYAAIFGHITPDELRRVEARRIAYEIKMSDFQKRPVNETEKNKKGEKHVKV